MTGRINPYTAAPAMLKAWMACTNQVAASGLEKPLLELVKIRASQINGCANCLNMHTWEARQAGETEQRIAVLAAWQEAPCYTDRERAAFLLHDVFGESFDDIAESLGRGPAACRQLASRARDHVRAGKPRFPVEPAHGIEIAQAFFAASRGGKVAQLGRMLADDVSFYSDGGGKRPAASRVMLGADEVMRTFAALDRLMRGRTTTLIRYAYINGLPGFVTREPDSLLQTTALLIEQGRVRAIYVMRNPDKLRHLETPLH